MPKQNSLVHLRYNASHVLQKTLRLPLSHFGLIRT